MRSLMKATLLGAGFLVVAAGTARAEVLEVKVPFAFVVSGQELPAGQYRVERHETNGSVVLIRGEKGTSASTFVLTTPAAGRNPGGDTAALIFTPYEASYHLIGVWESRSAGHEIPSAAGTSPRVAQTIVFADRLS